VTKFTDEDDALLTELGVDVAMPAAGSRSAHEERFIAGFEKVQRFVEEHGRTPEHGEQRDIFERLYAVRLDRIRESAHCLELLKPLDHQGVLKGFTSAPQSNAGNLNDDELLAQLGVDERTADLTDLRHVRSAADKRAAEEIANRQKCEDFERLAPLFDQVRSDLANGIRKAKPFNAASAIRQGDFFIVGGQIAFVAEVGEEFITHYDRRDSRLRVIYDNGTESNVLLRSLERALHRDPAGRRITDLSAGPLFDDAFENGDLESGTIYVVRSKSTDPAIETNRNVLHKIGVTGSDVDKRIANASFDPTYLMADVEIVATYKLANLNRTRLENLIHRVFEGARLDVNIKDRFGNMIEPREWFLVPLFVIDEVIDKIRDGSIVDFTYDPKTVKLVKTSTN